MTERSCRICKNREANRCRFLDTAPPPDHMWIDSELWGMVGNVCKHYTERVEPCGAETHDPIRGLLRCPKLKGHLGRHMVSYKRNGASCTIVWDAHKSVYTSEDPNPTAEPCGARPPNSPTECDKPKGHDGAHEGARKIGRLVWSDPTAEPCGAESICGGGGVLRCDAPKGHSGSYSASKEENDAIYTALWPNEPMPPAAVPTAFDKAWEESGVASHDHQNHRAIYRTGWQGALTKVKQALYGLLMYDMDESQIKMIFRQLDKLDATEQ